MKNFYGVLIYQHALVLLDVGAVLWGHLVLKIVASHASAALDDYVKELADLVDFHADVLFGQRVGWCLSFLAAEGSVLSDSCILGFCRVLVWYILLPRLHLVTDEL